MIQVIKWQCRCGKLLVTPIAVVRRKVRCPQCNAIIEVPGLATTSSPLAAANAPAPIRKARARSSPPVPRVLKPLTAPSTSPVTPGSPSLASAGAPSPVLVPATAQPTPSPSTVPPIRGRRSIGDFLYVVLLLALIPLALDTLSTKKPTKKDISDRLSATAKHHPELAPRIADWAARFSNGIAESDDLFEILPDQKLEGAALPRKTYAHWLFGVVAAAAFFALLLLLFPSAKFNRISLIAIGLMTATVGILVLLGFQFMAEWTQGRIMVGGGFIGFIMMIAFYIAKFIGFSYTCAIDPNCGFLISFFGFTFGVGLCEEICKAVPLLMWFDSRDAECSPSNTWQRACLWGLASGAAFGIAEGILYSTRQYNGVAPIGTYLMRFVSCTALHAVWSGSVGITMFNRQDELHPSNGLINFGVQVVATVGIAMTLHGLYDTLYKKDMPHLALGVAALSFCWLTYQIESMVRTTVPAMTPIADGALING